MDIRNIFNKKVEESDDYVPLFEGGSDDPGNKAVEESWGSILFGWVKGAFLLVFGGAIFLSILYTFLAAFLIMWAPIGSDSSWFDRENIVRNTWAKSGGIPPVGDQAVVSLSLTKANTSPLDYAIYGWTRIPDSAVVEVISKDTDRLYIETVQTGETNEEGQPILGGRVAVLTQEGQPTYQGFTGSKVFNFAPNNPESETPMTQNFQLDGEILVSCVSGDCKPDSTFIVSADQIFGEING